LSLSSTFTAGAFGAACTNRTAVNAGISYSVALMVQALIQMPSIESSVKVRALLYFGMVV